MMGKISQSHLKLLINIQDDLKKNWPFLFCSKQVTEFVWVTFIPEKNSFCLCKQDRPTSFEE